ncbi:MAG: aromatic ring-hydroxylating dioxygenase subunit alpha [Betaproteobacteria bacterium]|nr:aromatic ring-hydroxylating dioxygenase subunit alpha [Betaproteobacteria bacterium]
MGALFRRYWLPALLSEELPEPDCPPVRVTLLSEHLIAFRDTDGRLGLMDEFCAHRGVSLWLGRNEEGGLRCPYHGWKYDVTGQCIEVPSEPVESGYCKKIKLAAYPLVERGGVLWTYMGPPEHKPPLPEHEWAMMPPAHRFVSKRVQECNYLQAMEGGIDSSHVSFLHRYTMSRDPMFKHAKDSHRYNLGDTAPQFEVVESDGGLYIGVRRNTGDGRFYWRITQWVMPSFTLIPPRGDHPIGGHCWVPIDDETCWVFSFNHHVTRPLTQEERDAVERGEGIHAPLIPGTYRTVANKANHYLMDRKGQQAHQTFSGVHGFAMQDASVQESMGPIQDRTKENLVGTDNGVIMARQRLLRAARALAEKGVPPPALDPAVQRVRSVAIILPPGKAFKEAAKDALLPVFGAPHTTV